MHFDCDVDFLACPFDYECAGVNGAERAFAEHLANINLQIVNQLKKPRLHTFAAFLLPRLRAKTCLRVLELPIGPCDS